MYAQSYQSKNAASKNMVLSSKLLFGGKEILFYMHFLWHCNNNNDNNTAVTFIAPNLLHSSFSNVSLNPESSNVLFIKILKEFFNILCLFQFRNKLTKQGPPHTLKIRKWKHLTYLSLQFFRANLHWLIETRG